MSRNELTRAVASLREASEETANDAIAERIAGTAAQLERFAEADRGPDHGPDHGRMARIENTLREIEADAEGDAREAVERAHEHLSAYRETVEGV